MFVCLFYFTIKKIPFVFSFLRNLESRGTARRRAIPSISKSREEEIRKILRNNLQKTRQRVGDTGEACHLSCAVSSSLILPFACPQLRSYSRHDLMIDPFEDNVSEVRFRRQRVEMERRVSLLFFSFSSKYKLICG